MKIVKITLIVLVLLSFAFFLRATDLQKVISSVRLVGYRFIFLILITFLAYWSATVGWKCCMGSAGKKLSLTDLFFIRHIGEMVGIVNPTSIVGGEAVKVYLLKDHGIGQTTVITSVLISRAMMVITQLLLFFAAVAGLAILNPELFSSFPHVPVYFYFVLAASLILLFYSFRRFWNSSTIRESAIGKRIRAHRITHQLKEVVSQLGLFFRTNQRGLLLASLFFTLHWIFGSLEIYLILHFLGMKTGVLQSLLVDMGVIFFKAAGAFVPGQLGVEEFGNKVMLSAIGFPGAAVWLTVSFLRRARQIFWILFGLFIYFIRYKKRSSLQSS